jgi:hypothetical protein
MQLPDKEQFSFKDCVIGGDECWLITPSNMVTKWTNDNARFRSTIVRKSDHKFISQGFRKFVDYGVDPEFEPWDTSWKVDGVYKIDGSLLIVSRYNGKWIIRTRGTTDARQLPNGHEIDLLMKKYSNFFDDGEVMDYLEALEQSWLFEWTTPSNIICLRESEEPKLTLIGIVSNKDARYYSQNFLDVIAKEYGFDRPERYQYDSLKECIEDVTNWRGKEGIVLYSPDGNTLKRIKSDHYRALHRVCAGTRSISTVLDMFMISPRFVDHNKFYNYVSENIYIELAEKIKKEIYKICDAYGKFVHTLNIIQREIDSHIRAYETRKEQAIAIQRNWTGWMIPVAFAILDNKPIDDKLVKRSMEKILEL